MDDENIFALAEQVGRRCVAKGWWLVTAESCTGGWIGATVTAIPGSSRWFDRGFITYSDRAKQELLGVNSQTISQFGAVSAETVHAMANGALARSPATVSVAVSGVAGPGGGSVAKPVGTVWIAWALRGGNTRTIRYQFAGDRQAVRKAAVAAVFQGLLGDL